MNTQAENLTFRLFTAADVDTLPTRCQGDRQEILDRISRIGASAVVVFEAGRHVGQLQFRPYVPNTVSPSGLHHPLYWMDFQGHAPDLPKRTLALFCFHVGQTDNTQDRDPRYFGRGIGLKLLDQVLNWAAGENFEAVVAKGCPNFRPVIEYMGGMPTETYQHQGFTVAASYPDEELRQAVAGMLAGNFGPDRQKAVTGIDPDQAAEVSVCVKRY